jgi:hypothetical protein
MNKRWERVRAFTRTYVHVQIIPLLDHRYSTLEWLTTVYRLAEEPLEYANEEMLNRMVLKIAPTQEPEVNYVLQSCTRIKLMAEPRAEAENSKPLQPPLCK